MRQVMVLLAVLCTATVGAAQPVTQKLGKEATKGAATGLKEQGMDLGKSSREVVGGAVDSLVSRRQKVEMLSNDIGREVARGAVAATAGAIAKACEGEEHCIRSEARGIGFALGEGVAAGMSSKLSIVPSVLGFGLGFIVAALLALFIGLIVWPRRREAMAPLVPSTSH